MLAHSPAGRHTCQHTKMVGLEFDHAIVAPVVMPAYKKMALDAIDHSSSNLSMSACIFPNHDLFLGDKALRSTFMISVTPG